MSKVMKLKSRLWIVLGLVSLVLTGCYQRPHMSQDEFYSYARGTSMSTIIEEVGRPDLVKRGDAEEGDQYIYIDRISINRDVTEHIHYIFRVVDGAVVDKDIERFESQYPDINIHR